MIKCKGNGIEGAALFFFTGIMTSSKLLTESNFDFVIFFFFIFIAQCACVSFIIVVVTFREILSQ